MTSPEPPRPLRTKGRLPFEPPQAPGKAFKQAGLYAYALMTVGLAGLALYMALVVGHPLTSGFVAAPAIGALWFGLRTFMMLGSKG